MGQRDPVVLAYTTGTPPPFDPAGYAALGYTDFDVICIGAAGGYGSGIDPQGVSDPTFGYKASTGGGPGGGGIHRVTGLLSDLTAPCDIVIGMCGEDKVYSHSATTMPGGYDDGGDGGYSSFGDDLCMASGGKGGKKATDPATPGVGGDGGVGGQITAGGGSTGVDGTWDGIVGQGGKGATGGVIDQYSRTRVVAPDGATMGAYSGTDLSVFDWPAGEGGYYERYLLANPPSYMNVTRIVHALTYPTIWPQGGGGAKATPLNNLSQSYGNTINVTTTAPDMTQYNGLVVIKLTSV